MNNQNKIKVLKELLDTCLFSISEGYNYQDTEIQAKLWLQELEQSNNKYNIDNWSNRELFDYCVENKLFDIDFSHNIVSFTEWNNTPGRKYMINIISKFKSQK